MNIRFNYTKKGRFTMQFIEFNQFEISSTLVTNKEFKEFTDATNYLTTAEKLGNSFVFYAFIEDGVVSQQVKGTPWWHLVEKADWKHPFGPKSDNEGLSDHPVVHVSFQDAKEFSKWKGLRLPNELEWEVAANPEKVVTKFPWGDSLKLKDQYMCNTWTGEFPKHNTKADGFYGTSPVKHYPPNLKGMYDVVGNVWEWSANKASAPIDNIETTMDISNEEWVSARGGSFLCHKSYCNKHVIGARNKFQANTTASNLGFRVLKDKKSF